MISADEGETAIEVTVTAGAVTAIPAEPVTPLSAAEIVVFPGESAVARPAEFTVATVVAEDVHVTDEVTLLVELLL
jgi:hypothetical protein